MLRPAQPTASMFSRSSFFDPHFPEHPGFHVEEEMAVVGPATERVGAHPVAALRARRHVDGVLAQVEVALFVLKVAPQAMQKIGCDIMVSFTSTMRMRSP